MDKTYLIHSVVEKLKLIPNLQAVVLGGSYATGTQRPNSDIDLGLYYFQKNPFIVEDIKKLANEISDIPNPIVTNFNEWGKWVNGGAWLTIKGQRVDFLYRNLDFVSQIIANSLRGERQSDYYQQPPYGFHSYIYLAEINVCKPLFDPQKSIAKLKSQITTYPYALKKSIINGFLWSVEFTLNHAEKSASRGEIYIVGGCMTKIMSELVQVIYALNETYFIGDKKVCKDMSKFRLIPTTFLQRMEEIIGKTGTNKDELAVTYQKAKELFHETVMLTKGMYIPKYKI